MIILRGNRVVLRVAGVAVAAMLMTILLATMAWAAAYPNPPHDFAPVAGAGSLYNVASGANPRPLLVVLVTFSDAPTPSTLTAEAVGKRIFGGVFPNVVDYYRANSFNKMYFTRAAETCDTANDGIVTVNVGTKATYDSKLDENAAPANTPATNTINRFVMDAVDARGCVNFAAFDRNGDQHITDDELTILMIDAENNPNPCGATRVILGSPSYNGVELDKTMSRATSQTDIITLAHEVGHSSLSTRDLYGFGVGRFDLYGPTCGYPDTTMFNFNAWQKTHLGWIVPTVVTADGFYNVPRADTNPSAFILYDPDRGTNDYFIVENREEDAGGYDQNATENGLVIWRADDSQYASANDSVRPIEIMRTDGATNPVCSMGCYAGSEGDAWDSGQVQTPQSTMSRTWRDGTGSNVAVRAICDAADTMRVYFDVRGPGVMVNACRRPEDTLHPGDATTVTFPVMNTGEAPDTFSFTVHGLPAGWTASTDVQTLAANTGGVAHVQITPTPDAATGTYAYKVAGASTSNGRVFSEADTSGNVVLDRTVIANVGATSNPTGEAAGFKALVTDPDLGGAGVVGDMVTFMLSDGTHRITTTQLTDGSGIAASNPPLTVPPGNYSLAMSVSRHTRHGAATTSVPYSVLRRPTKLVYSGDLSQDYHDSATVIGTLTDSINGGPLANKAVAFSLGAQSAGPFTTSPVGVATSSVVINQPSGAVTVSAAFGGDAIYLPSTDSQPFAIQKEETSAVYTGDTGLIANGRTAHLSGVLTEDGTVPIEGRTMILTLGEGGSAQSCPAITDATGSAACTIQPVIQPLGPGMATAAFAGDIYYLPSSGSGSTVIFQPGGAFAISANLPLMTIPRQPNIICPPGGSASQVQVVGGVGILTGLSASCHTDPISGTTTPHASIDRAVLFGGALVITNIRSDCTAGPGGVSCTSSVGTVNGLTIGTSSVTLDVFGVGRVALNEVQSNGPGLPVRNAVRIATLLGQVTLAESYFN